jgi:hypothetical protein
MKTIFASLVILFSQFSFAGDPVLGWECSEWADHTYILYCGGAVIAGHYAKGIDCVNARKEICGQSIGDYECRKWPDNTYYLYCGGAYIGHYDTAIACVKGHRATCD